MISVICVYNKKRVLDEVLMRGLLRQSEPFELIAIDHSENAKESVVEALNRGGAQASGRYLMFVHQDVEVISPNWLHDVERMLDSISGLGIAGVAGAKRSRGTGSRTEFVGHIMSGGREWGQATVQPTKAQTLDELVLIVPRDVFREGCFDAETFDSIHLFGVDYCLRAAREGLGIYVIPAFVRHASNGDATGMDKYRVRLFLKHRDASPIFTTTGEISYRTFLRCWLLSLLPYRFNLALRQFRRGLIGRTAALRKRH